jgi:polyisoprenoid-binding protein YceI
MNMTDNLVQQKIDSTLSRFTARAFASGILSMFGHNPNFVARDIQGEISYTPDKPEESKVVVRINPVSFEVTDNIAEKDRREIQRIMFDEVLNVQQYRQILFESSTVTGEKVSNGTYRISIEGNLTLHGVVKPKTIQGHVTVSNDSLRAYGEFSIFQSEFGIKRISVAAGGLEVKDEVKISFDIVAK